MWNRAFVEGACSHPSCSTFFCGGYKRGLHAFQGGQRHHRCFGVPEGKKGGRGGGEASAGEPALATLLWGTIYADDAGVVSQSPEQLRKKMGVMVVVCSAFGLTVSEAKTEIMCLCTKRMPEFIAIENVRLRNAGRLVDHCNQ